MMASPHGIYKRRKGETMRTARIMIRGLAWIIIATLVMPSGIVAQDSGEPEQPEKFKKEELAQMLAPIALYPDSLIAQILMASTYPLEVVAAERWLRQNEDLKGEALDSALQEKNWDPSVKSLCHSPEVLFAMSDKLDQTRKLGDAFLSQEDDVMAEIQELRRRAEEQGNLKTTGEQQVIVEREIIRIEPADPEVVYVPVYDPFYVYGPWWYPAYPPWYWYYPPGFVLTGGHIFFGPRIFFGFGFSWAWFDWHFHHVHIDVHKVRRFHRFPVRREPGTTFWRHDPRHRRGVAYRDRVTSDRFGGRPTRVSPRGSELRGYPARDIERKIRREPSRRPAERRDVGPGRERIKRVPRRGTPFSGIGGGSFERKAGERGGESRRSGVRREPAGPRRQPGGVIRQPGGGVRQPGGVPRGGGRGDDRRR